MSKYKSIEISQYQTTEGETEVVRLSVPILTRHQIPAFTGTIEVDITAEDLPSGDPRQNYIQTHYYIVCPVDVIPFCIEICPLYISIVIEEVTKQNGSKFCT